jgi:hypothetical protein
MSEITHHIDYHQALAATKQRIQSSQTRAAPKVNAKRLGLYWDIGRQLDAGQRDINKPMGVRSFITKETLLAVQSQLPTVQEIESELTALIQDDGIKPNE